MVGVGGTTTERWPSLGGMRAAGTRPWLRSQATEGEGHEPPALLGTTLAPSQCDLGISNFLVFQQLCLSPFKHLLETEFHIDSSPETPTPGKTLRSNVNFI